MSNVKAFPAKAESDRPAPKRILRPCEWGLMATMRDLETQMGTVEAYNRLCDAAASLKARIDAGEATAPADMWLTDPKWIYPAGMAPK